MLCNIRFIKSIKVFCVPYSPTNSLFVNFSKSLTRNRHIRDPYEVLGLKDNCSTKDVKKAYIKLCKELHPDKKPGDSTRHKKFVELNDAYSTLVNETSRRQFDGGTAASADFRTEFYYQKKPPSTHSSNPFEKDTKEDEAWYERQTYKEQEELFKRQQQNSHIRFQANQNKVLYGCFFLIVIGCIMYYAAYSYAKNYTLRKVDEKSRKISEQFKALQKVDAENRKDAQLEKLKRSWTHE